MYRIGSPMFENKRRYNTMQLQESNLAARQPQGATSVIQATTGEGLAQGPYVEARGGVEPTTFRTEGTEGTDNIHLTNLAPHNYHHRRCCHHLHLHSSSSLDSLRMNFMLLVYCSTLYSHRLAIIHGFDT